MANPPSDQGIPLLTEVIDSQSEAAPAPASVPARPAPPTPAVSPASSGFVAPAAPGAPATINPAPGQPKPGVAPSFAAPLSSADSLPRATPVPASPARASSASAAATTPQQPPAMADIPLAASAAAPAKARAGTVPVENAGSTDSASPADTWTDTELRDLENDLRLRITRQVLGRIDFVLDHRVRNSVTEVVDAAIDTLAAEIKRGLHETLTDIVARAVAQEISRLQSGKK